jgi:hypothetical protein
VNWSGPVAEVWIENGQADPELHSESSVGISAGFSITHPWDHKQFVFATATRIAFVDIYSSVSTPDSHCTFAYQHSEYQR